jgi:hypothetical protein
MDGCDDNDAARLRDPCRPATRPTLITLGAGFSAPTTFHADEMTNNNIAEPYPVHRIPASSLCGGLEAIINKPALVCGNTSKLDVYICE